MSSERPLYGYCFAIKESLHAFLIWQRPSYDRWVLLQ